MTDTRRFNMNINEWENVTVREEVSIEELDQAVLAFKESREDYEAKKKISNEADVECKLKKKKLLELLERAGKKSWEVDGVGKVTETIKMAVTTPKDFESKKQVIEYFRSLGDDLYYQYVSVNSQTLNGYYNKEKEINPDFHIPGLADPTADKNIQFRTAKKK